MYIRREPCCKKCNSYNLTTDSGHDVCMNCGLVGNQQLTFYTILNDDELYMNNYRNYEIVSNLSIPKNLKACVRNDIQTSSSKSEIYKKIEEASTQMSIYYDRKKTGEELNISRKKMVVQNENIITNRKRIMQSYILSLKHILALDQKKISRSFERLNILTDVSKSNKILCISALCESKEDVSKYCKKLKSNRKSVYDVLSKELKSLRV